MASELQTDRETLKKAIEKIRPLSIAAQVYEALRRQITENRLEEKSALVISSLAAEFGVSHTPVREALARLHAEGLATFTGNIGYRVTPRPTETDYRHWMQARLAIEVGAMRCIDLPLSSGDINQLEMINSEIASAGLGAGFESTRQFSELNRAFHRHLIGLCGNPFLAKAYEQIWLGAQFSRVHFERGVYNQAAIVREHQLVIDALRNGKVDDACQLLSSHIVESLNRDASSTRSIEA
jgi:DNA-binding GntR family transcriptional regulator